MATKKKRTVYRSKRGLAPLAFPVVGIGASAGGFEAFGEMLNALRPDTGMAFVLIQHLDPTHESMLAPLLARNSALPVSQVTDGMVVEPNRVYVTPPNARMGIHDGLLKLVKRAAPGGKNMPIDHFFQSLAACCKHAAIGVILSGTATDGTFGLRAIKAEGGICFAQDEESAKYPGMPGSAIAAGCVDFALPPRKIAAELTRIVGHTTSGALVSIPDAAPPPAASTGCEGHIRRLLLLLRNATGADFTDYKGSAIQRRIARRMLLKKIGSIREYVEVLRRDGAELDALYRDLLIHVTSSFREPELFQALESQIIPQVILRHSLEDKMAADPLRAAPPLIDSQKEADRIVWSRSAHAGVIVGENLQILHFRGDTSPYMDPAASMASPHLLKMVRRDLLVDLRAAFHKSKKKNATARKEGIRMTSNGRVRAVSLYVVPLSALNNTERHFLILFEDSRHEPARTKPAKAVRRVKAETTLVSKLQQELFATREYLQAIIEEQETTNEELKAANEEALSNNEELQSTNEELETAKEELQSTNEELMTLTEQQALRNVELNHLNDDLRNVLDGIQIPILMLDNDRRIRRFTSSAEKLFNLLPTDIGRVIQNLRPNLDLTDLQPLISRAIGTLAVQEQEVRDLEGRHYSMSVRPYRTSDHRIDGVLIALVDTDTIKRSLEEARRARDYASAIVETVREPLLVLDSSLCVLTANLSFYATFHLSPEEVEKRRILDLADGAWNIPNLRNLLEKILPQQTQFGDFKLTHAFPNIGRRTLLLNARGLRQGDRTEEMILLAMEDITDRELTAQKLHESSERLRDLTAGLLTAQEEERRRISRELHDDLNQRLAMLTVELEMLEKGPLQSAELIRSQLAGLRARTEGISDDVRRTAHRLHPSVVDHLGLSAALRSLCADFSKLEEMRIRYRQRNVNEIPPEVALCLYRVAQEALHNVVKHSGARRATVSLVVAKDVVLLSISDTGVGFDPTQMRSRKGLGIISMEERVRLVLGELAIRSRTGAGTRVVAKVPLPEATLAGKEK